MSVVGWIEQKMNPFIGKLATNIYVQSIKEGMISVIGLTIVGSFFLLIAYLPVPDAWYDTIGFLQWIEAHRTAILMPFRATMSVIAIFAVVGTAIALSNKTQLDPTVITILSLIAFFMTLDWTYAMNIISSTVVSVSSENQTMIQTILGKEVNIGESFTFASGTFKNLGLVLPVSNMDSSGIFVGFLCVFTVVAVFRLFKKNQWTIKMPEGVPDGVSKTFESLLPLLVIVSIFSLLYLIPSIFPSVFPTGKIDLHTILQKLFFWLPIIVNSLPGALVMVFFIGILWTAGIHGSSVVEAFTLPVLLQLFTANAQAYIDGTPIPYVLTNQFYYAFIWIGGGGATLALTLQMAFMGRSEYMKTLGKSCLTPSLFNINEPIVFGTPIVINPYFFVPYVFGPMICVIVSYTAIKLGLVNPTVAASPWTFPSPLYAFVATGGDWRAIILVLVNLAIMFAIYLPFFWAYDSKLYKEEQIGG